MISFILGPFLEPSARPALVAMFALSLGAAPVGVFLMLRRMALMGDTMAHAILPGVAIAVTIAGLDIFAMSLGGIAAGLVVALLAGVVSRATPLKEDSSLAAFFLISVALGFIILSATGRDEEVLHVLFGNVKELDAPRLILIAVISTVSMLGFAVIWRPLVIECVDPQFLRTVSGAGGPVHYVFTILVVLNLVAAFQALGTLLAVGLMMLPAVSARFWARDITRMVIVAVAVALVSGYLGLAISIQSNVPGGPAVILIAGLFYVGSVLFGTVGGVAWRFLHGRHLEA